jgi:hypothetical protein
LLKAEYVDTLSMPDMEEVKPNENGNHRKMIVFIEA